jgi:ABC-type amino acid transport substrate-binding protein
MFKIIFIIPLLFFSLSANSYQGNEVDTKVLVVAAESNLLQYREDGEDKGSTIEILQEILKESQIQANVEFMPWARAYSIANTQANTLILSMIRTPEREQYFHWLLKVSNLVRVFISLADKPENYVSNNEQAKGKLIAVIRNSAEHKELIKLGFSEDVNLYVVSSTTRMLSLFINGRVDLLYSDPEIVKDYLNQQIKMDIAISYQGITLENQRNSYIAANKDINKNVLNRLHAAASKFKKTPKYFELLAQ